MRVKVGIIGLGYWGPNYIRNFINHEQTEVIWACDLLEKSFKRIGKLYPNVELETDYTRILEDKKIDLIAIATPPETHYQIAKQSLLAGKHVLIAKPLTTKSSQAKELAKIAKKKNLLLHCDFTYLYTGAVRTIKNLVDSKVIGEPLYYDSIRTNLGLIQSDVNVIWDLAPHDLSILDYWFGYSPKQIYAVGSSHHGDSSTEEIAHISIKYTNNFVAHIHVSWISPVKLRTILVGGSKKMIFFDDVEPDEKVKIYNKGIEFPPGSVTSINPVYRSGNIITPKLGNKEALFIEVNDVVSQITRRRINYSNAQTSIKIIRILEMCDQSLKSQTSVNFEDNDN